MLKTVFASTALMSVCVNAQQVGTQVKEAHPSLPMTTCNSVGECTQESTTVVLDQNWRWTHGTHGYSNCYTGTSWDPKFCPDPVTCASNCALEGNTLANYEETYEITTNGNMLKLGYVAPHGNVGSRTYLLEAVPPPVKHTYVEYTDKNCYDGHGGTAIDGSGVSGQTVAECTASCDADPACECATFQASNGMCWLRSNCVPAQFEDSDQYSVYFKQTAVDTAKAKDSRRDTVQSAGGQCSACGYNCHGSCNDCGHCNDKPGCDTEAACTGACNSGGNAMWCGGSGPPPPPPPPPPPSPAPPTNHVCADPGSNPQCNVCAMCCHSFIPAGAPCDKCVSEKCKPSPSPPSPSPSPSPPTPPSPPSPPGPAGPRYKLFMLKNREFSVDVDVSTLPCGLNGALYFVEMDADGGMARFPGNKAGAGYGTGYCDAQCPHDVKFINGEANILDWDTKTAEGKYGSCCTEMDIWEANMIANALTPHPCTVDGQTRCGDSGVACGGDYNGVCDQDGCDYNPWRVGNQTFFGPGSNFTIDTTKPFTVATTFVTVDNTDAGDLKDITRHFVQNGVKVPFPAATLVDPTMSSVTDAFCAKSKAVFNNTNDFAKKGGMKRVGDVLAKGMVLVMSLWDDAAAHMLWLDSLDPPPAGSAPPAPGVSRGSCATSSGVPSDVRREHPDAYVTYANIKLGPIPAVAAAATHA